MRSTGYARACCGDQTHNFQSETCPTKQWRLVKREMFSRALLLRYGVGGVANATVGYTAILFGMYGLGQDLYVANAFGYAIGLTFAYFAGRHWVFSATGKSKTVARQAPIYIISVALAYGLNLVVVWLADRTGAPGWMAQFCGSVAYSILLFFLSTLVVFGTAGGRPARERRKDGREAVDG